MANLETLELTINGSAEGAKTGISGLITSLSVLSRAVGKSVGGLKKLNAELRELKKYGRIKLPSLASISGSAATKAAKKATTAANPNTNGVNNIDVSKLTYPGAVPKEKYEKDLQENIERNKKQIELNRKIIAEARARQAEEAKIAAAAARTREQEAISMIKSGDKIGLMQKKLGGMTADYVKNAREGKLSAKQMADGALQINNLQDKILKAEEEAKNAPTVFQQLKKGVGNSFKDLTKGAAQFFGRIKKIATTMLIRSAIRGLIKSVKEGINNLYEWSKLNNGEFAKSLDTIHAKTAQLKNSIGASIAPVIQAALPAINALANAAITAFNYVNQLIALLTGQSYWTKAAEGANEYAEAASGAGSAAKEWLASFDELNVMNSSGGGGGGGGAAGQFDDMFENVTKFDESIREIADFLKNNFETIKTIAIEIGAAILAWKLGNAFAETLPTLSKIMGFAATGLTIAITLEANWILTNQYLDTGKEGWLLASMLTTAVGSTAAWAIAKKLIGGQAGLYAAGITLAFTAVTDIIANVQHTDVSAFSKESVLTNLKAALSAGAAAGILLKATGAAAALGTAGTLFAAGGVALAVFAVATLLKLATAGATNYEWGSIELSDEEIEAWTKKNMFDITAYATITKIEATLAEKDQLTVDLNNDIAEIDSNLNVLRLGVDEEGTYARMKEVIAGVNGNSGLVAKMQELMDMNIDLLKLNVANITMYDGNGNEIDSDVLLSAIPAWQDIKNEMEANGKELTELLFRGAEGNLNDEEKKYTQKLLEKVIGISQKIANSQAFASSYTDFQTAALSAMSKNSIVGITEAFKTFSAQNENTIRESLKQQISSYYTLSELKDDPEMKAKWKKMADDLVAGFDKTLAEDLAKTNSPAVTAVKDWITGKHGNTATVTWDKEYLKDFLNVNTLSDTIEEILLESGFQKQEIDLMNLVGISGWDYLADEMKERLIDALFELNGSNSGVVSAAAGVGAAMGGAIIGGMKDSESGVTAEAEKINNIVADKVEVKHPVWVSQTSDKIKAVGNKITEWLTGTIDKKNHTVPVSTKKANVDKIGTDLTSQIGKKRYANVALSDSAKTQLNTALQKAAGTTNVNVKANVTLNNANKLTQSVQNAIEKVRLKFANVTVPFASGGFPETGQLFLAREAGAEMVGSIGNRTAVANNDQIVKGISSGVASANEEQNELLRKQNQILMGILQKTGSSGMPGASAAMGRVIQQSLEMYSAVTGG